MEKDILLKLKEQATAELKSLGEDMGRLQYQVILRNTFLQGVEAELKKLEDAQGSVPQA